MSGLPYWPSPGLFCFSSIALLRPRAKCLFFVQGRCPACHTGLHQGYSVSAASLCSGHGPSAYSSSRAGVRPAILAFTGAILFQQHCPAQATGQVLILRPGPVSGLPYWLSPGLFRFSSIALLRPQAKCLFFVQLQYCHKGLGGKLHTPQAPHLLFISPQKLFLLWGPL